MDNDLGAKTAIVTGGARGIGRCYARGLAAAGAAVLVADLLEDEGRETVKEIEAEGGRAVYLSVDVSDVESTERMAATATSELGGVDILVNNAAMFANMQGGPLTDIPVDRWDRTMAVNVKGPWLCMRAVVPYMRQRGGGAILNQSSIAALGGSAFLLDYGTSKAALIGLTKNAAVELGPDRIRVNAIAPGAVATAAAASFSGGDMSAVDAMARSLQVLPSTIQPEDLVGPMLFLVSDASKFTTGQTLVFDGGRFFLG
jgi:NAD(P)-dependent dehydrogenase (short-subunit alcohol dehydrogenase family)